MSFSGNRGEDMKKILFFIPTLTGGGAERVLVTAVNALNPSKYEIVVQTLVSSGIYQEQLNNNIKYRSIISSRNSFIQRVCAYFLQFVLPASLVYRMFVKDDYDVEIAFLEGFPVKLISASCCSGAKKYTWVHIDLYKYYIGKKVFRNWEHNRKCYEKFDKIMCVSRDVREAFYQRFGFMNNVEVQYNVLDDSNIQKRANEKVEFRKSDASAIVSIGRLCHQKGFDRLIRTTKRLFDAGVYFQLYILGDGEDRPQLEELIRKMALEEYVHMEGFCENPYKYINKADLFVCSSYAEGFSTVATEAIILGKPIVTTECAGMKDLLGDNEYGLIVENSEEGLFEGLYSMLSNESLIKYYSCKAKERSNEFSMDRRIKEYEKLLDE